jgi:hypothetical protein
MERINRLAAHPQLRPLREALADCTINAQKSVGLKKVVGGPGVKPGFAASDATVLFGYTTHPSGTRAGNPTRISSLGPKRHHALDHASRTTSGRDAEN